MKSADGPFGNVSMGGMFTILKVRDGDPRTETWTPAGIRTLRAR